MMRIRSRSLDEMLHALPDIEPLEITRHDDIFVAVLGFEERALSVPRTLAVAGYKCPSTLYVQYRNTLVENSVNLGALITALTNMTTVPPISIPDSEAGQRIRGHVLSLASLSD